MTVANLELPKLPRYDETEKLRFNDLVAKEGKS